MKQMAQEIIQCAESVNFDAGKMADLQKAVGSGDEQTIMSAVSQAKQRAAEMMKEEGGGYQEFRRYLLKGQGVLKDKF
jgi:hypothetical protein